VVETALHDRFGVNRGSHGMALEPAADVRRVDQQPARSKTVRSKLAIPHRLSDGAARNTAGSLDSAR